MMQRALFFTLFTLLLSGCSYNPFSTDNHLTGKPVGVGVGAAAGVGTAALAGASRTGIVVTGLAGAAVGYYATTMGFASGGIQRAGGEVYSQGDCVTINLPSWRIFEHNSADFRRDAPAALESTVQVLGYFPNNDVVVSGNSSGFGPAHDERQLTRRRAEKVAGYLRTHGVTTFREDNVQKQRRLTVIGYGNRFPVANDITAKGISENSRIQISSCPCGFGEYDGTAENVGRYKGDDVSPSSNKKFRPPFNH